MGTLIVNQYLSGLDSDAASYIAAVEVADGQTLEETTKTAINDFIVGCKTDGIWDAIKASCILAGARTLAGALTPLVGVAPTNYNFVTGDYDRKTGLKGNGVDKYLNSNRANDADPQDSNHNSFYITTPPNITCAFAGAGISVQGSNSILSTRVFRSRTSAVFSRGTPVISLGFQGINREISSSATSRFNGYTELHELASEFPNNLDMFIFGRNDNNNLNLPTDAGLSFYSIGESLNLDLLDNRVTQLMTDINNAF